MQITTEQVRQLGQLARLELTEDEVVSLVEQLPKIVDYVSQLQSVDAPTLVEPHQESAPLRHDMALPAENVDLILGQAPERSERYWKVDAVWPTV